MTSFTGSGLVKLLNFCTWGEQAIYLLKGVISLCEMSLLYLKGMECCFSFVCNTSCGSILCCLCKLMQIQIWDGAQSIQSGAKFLFMLPFGRWKLLSTLYTSTQNLCLNYKVWSPFKDQNSKAISVIDINDG